MKRNIKRGIICLMLLAAMLTGMMSAYAAEAEITVDVRASQTEVQVGDTVEFTVLATGSGVVAMQFNLELPEGLSYVPNSGKTPDNLAQKLGVPAADWTELSKMFTFYNDVGITFAKGTEILSFSCVAEKEGTWTVNLYELLPFNGDFEEFTPKLQVQTVTVTDAQTQTTSPTAGETEPAVPNVTQPTTPIPDDTEGETEPVIETDPVEDEGAKDPVAENPGQEQDEVITVGAEEDAPQNQQTEEAAAKNSLPWIVLAGVGVLAIGGAVVLILNKKKNS